MQMPQIREFERVSTTIVNAFTGPSMQSYLNHLDERFREDGFTGELFVMQSNGGVQNVIQSGKFAAGGLLSVVKAVPVNYNGIKPFCFRLSGK